MYWIWLIPFGLLVLFLFRGSSSGSSTTNYGRCGDYDSDESNDDYFSCNDYNDSSSCNWSNDDWDE